MKTQCDEPRGGRPKQYGGKRISLRLTQEQTRIIKEIADRKGKTLSETVRWAIIRLKHLS